MAIGERSVDGLVALEVVGVEPNEEQDIAINLHPLMVEGRVLVQVLNKEVVIPTGVECQSMGTGVVGDDTVVVVAAVVGAPK